MPQARAAQGAGLLAKTGTGLLNVAGDTALGAGSAAMGAPPGERMQAAQDAAAPTAALSTVLRTPGAAANAAGAARRGMLSILPEDVGAAAERMTSMTPEGRASRQAAREGSRTLEPTIGKVTDLLNDTETMTDQVLDYAKVGLKRDPVLKGMRAEGVDPGKAAADAQGVVSGVFGEIDQLSQRSGELEPAGKQAIRYAKEAFESAYDKFAKRKASGAPEEAAADLFMDLDHLKRRLGRAVKRAGTGANADPFVEEALSNGYHQLRDLLETESVWGKSAATVQREVNAAWTPWLTTRKAYQKELLASEPIRRGAEPFDPLLDADPKKVESVFKDAGTVGNRRREQVLGEGLDNTKKLTKALAQHYEAPPEIMAQAAGVAKNAHEISDELGRTRENLVAARELRDISKESPKLGKVVNVTGAAEEALRNSGVGKLAQAASARIPQGVKSAAGAVADIGPEVGRKAAAASAGKASAEESRQIRNDSLLDKVHEALNADPSALGEFGPVLARAKSPDDFAIQHRALMETDGEYRRLIKELGKRDSQAAGATP
jgi:hypothetical protein